MRALALVCGVAVLGCVLACGNPGNGEGSGGKGEGARGKQMTGAPIGPGNRGVPRRPGAPLSTGMVVRIDEDLVIPGARGKMVRTESGDRMEVRFTATNKTAYVRVAWRQKGDSFVRDEHGNTYKAKWASPGRDIDPDESAELLLVFDVPAKQAKRLTLHLDAKGHLDARGHRGRLDVIRLTFDRPPDLPPKE
jgi:hypothetical protein